jgi:hypothetical protein
MPAGLQPRKTDLLSKVWKKIPRNYGAQPPFSGVSLVGFYQKAISPMA